MLDNTVFLSTTKIETPTKIKENKTPSKINAIRLAVNSFNNEIADELNEYNNIIIGVDFLDNKTQKYKSFTVNISIIEHNFNSEN